MRLGAHRGVEKAPVRAHGQRADDIPRFDARARLQRAVGLHAVAADVAVRGIGDVDEGSCLSGYTAGVRF